MRLVICLTSMLCNNKVYRLNVKNLCFLINGNFNILKSMSALFAEVDPIFHRKEEKLCSLDKNILRVTNQKKANNKNKKENGKKENKGLELHVMCNFTQVFLDSEKLIVFCSPLSTSWGSGFDHFCPDCD